MSSHVLLLPGWHNSGAQHWQTLWEAKFGYTRVVQHDWERPLRGDWLIQLEEAVLASTQPAVLVAHSLGCILVAAWGAHSRNTHLVKAAMLVAPGDVEREEVHEHLPSWSPIARGALPFESILVASRNDVHCSFERAQVLAKDWAAELVDAGNAGHINAESQLGGWPQGHEILKKLI